MIGSPGALRSPSGALSALEDSYDTTSGYVVPVDGPPSVNKLPSLRNKNASPVSAARKTLFIGDGKELQLEQEALLGKDELPTLPVDGTVVKEHLLPTDSSVVDTSSNIIKKSEVAEGKLKNIAAGSTSTETLGEETSSPTTMPLPTATAPVDSTENRRRGGAGRGGNLQKKARN